MRNARKQASTVIGAAASALCVLACVLALAFVVTDAAQAPAPSAAVPSTEAASGTLVHDLAFESARAADKACGYEIGTVIATLKPGDGAASLPAALEQATGHEGWRVTDVDGSVVSLAIPDAMPVAVAVEAANTSGAVDFAQPDYTYALQGDGLVTQAMTNDPYVVEGKLWALESIHAYEAWDTVHTNRTVTVAVLDDGFNMEHEDLRDNMISEGAFNAQKNAYEPGVTTVTDDMRDVSGGQGHGTHVAGIVSGTANNSKGVAGVSYNARVLPVKVFNDVTNQTSTAVLVRAYDYVLDNADKYGVRVVNLSLGFGRTTTSWNDLDLRLKAKIDEAYERGIVTVVAACNEGYTGLVKFTPPFSCFPGDLPNVVTVISLKRSGSGAPVRSDKSNYNLPGSANATKNISAPGDLIWSTYKGGADDYSRMSGTSMATPYVSGVLALMFAADEQLFGSHTATAAATAIDRLYATADDLVYSTTSERALAGWDVYTGHGMVNAAAAVAENAVSISGDSTLAKGNVSHLTLAPAQVDADSWRWASSNPDVVHVAFGGTVTAKGAGTATVTAANGEGSRFAACTITVYDLAITGAASMSAGMTANYTIPTTPIGTYRWESSDTSVASVSAAGVVTAKKPGSVTITVRLVGHSAISASKQLTVVPGNIAQASVSVSGQTYTGRALTPVLTVRLGALTLKAGVDYIASYDNNVNAGTARITITGIGAYEGVKKAAFKIARSKNPFTATAKAISAKASALKKKAKLATALAVKNPSGAKLSYKKISGSAKLSVNAATGKLTVKKSTSRGTYKAILAITSAATKNYATTKKTVTVTVKVK